MSTLALGGISIEGCPILCSVGVYGVHVEEHRTLVALRDRVVGVIGHLCSTNDVAPLDANLIACLDVDDLARYWGLEAGLAGYVGVIDVAD